jgi:hypothetical protein
MLINSRIIGSVMFGLVLLTGSAWAASPTIQGDVIGPGGKPLAGAEVKVERKDAKAPIITVKTDRKGQYVARDLAVGSYAITVSAAGMATTAATNVKPKFEGMVRVNFVLQAQTGTAQAGTPVKKKAKHMVWMAAQTGTNIGGRWVEVDDSGNVEGAADGVQRNSGAALLKAQGGQRMLGSGN